MMKRNDRNWIGKMCYYMRQKPEMIGRLHCSILLISIVFTTTLEKEVDN